MKKFALIFLASWLITSCQRPAVRVTPLQHDRAQARASWQIANAHYQRHDYANAIKEYDLALRLDPGLAAAWFNRGNARFRSRNLAGAIADYNHALQLDADFADAYYNRATAHFSLR